MTVTTISSRDFARDLANAKRAAASGPVFITDRGSPRYVLQTVEDYYKATTGKSEPTLLEAMQSIDSEPTSFDPPRMNADVRPAEFEENGHG